MFHLGILTYQPVLGAVAWSFSLMDPGGDQTFPVVGHDGRRWREGSMRARRAASGVRIAAGYSLILTQITGDWKFLKEFLGESLNGILKESTQVIP